MIMPSLFSSVASWSRDISTWCVKDSDTHCKHWFWVKLALITFISTFTAAVDNSTICTTVTDFCFCVWNFWNVPLVEFNRAMLRRAQLCCNKSSVCPSVCPSVTLRHDFHTGRNTSKTISRPNSLRLLLGLIPTWASWANGNTPKISVE